jgi:hypothetical protein
MACRLTKGAIPISGQGPMAMYFCARFHHLGNAQGAMHSNKKTLKN